MKKFLFMLLVLLALVGQALGQSSPVRVRMPDSTYSAILVGVAGTRTAGDTISGVWSTYYRMHEFSGVAATGRYKLYVDAAGGTSYTLVSTWGGTYGKVIAGYDLYQWMERLNANEEVLSIGLGDSSVSLSKTKYTQIDTSGVVFSSTDSCIHRFTAFTDPVAEIEPKSDHAVYIIRIAVDSVVVGIPVAGYGTNVSYSLRIKEK